jgi:hypothetical protein
MAAAIAATFAAVVAAALIVVGASRRLEDVPAGDRSGGAR